jgi:chromosome segregation ATPase
LDLTVLVPLAIALVAPVGAYLLAARKMSGKIATSDATQLWAEARNIRDDYRSRLIAAGERYSELEARVANLERVNTGLVAENYDLKAKIAELEKLVEAQQKTITSLQSIIESQKEELKETK